jgi:two-component system sensor histidine kinase UhpB
MVPEAERAHGRVTRLLRSSSVVRLEGGSLAAGLPEDSQPVALRAPARPRGRQISLLWRVFLANAGLVVAATLVLAFTPATVSTPVTKLELGVLLVGAALVLGVNLLVLRQVLAPLRQLAEVMTSIEPEHPGRRVAVAPQDSEIGALAEAFNAMLDRLEGERRESARVALAAQERERLRVAQELHDQIGQGLTAVMLQAERGAQTSSDASDELLRIARAVRDNLDEVRGIARQLRPEALDDLGLVNALIALCNRLSGHGGLLIKRHFQTPMPSLSSEAELVIYRVAQEALTNVARHADASEAKLSLEHGPDLVTLTVRDDGRGIEPSDGTGSGIRGMRERSLLVGGRLRIERAAAGGTEVRLDLPLEAD